MADRTETLLFLIDVQVNNARALRQLDRDLDAAFAARERRLIALTGLASGGSAAGRSVGPTPSVGEGQVVGVRGPVHPGSRTNPVVTAAESGQAAGLGSLAAASGATSADQAARAAPVPAVGQAPEQAPSVQKQWLATAAQEVAQRVLAPDQQRVIDSIQAAARTNGATNGGGTGLAAALSLARSAQGGGGGGGGPVLPVAVGPGGGGGGGGGALPVPVRIGGGGGGGGGPGLLRRLGWGAGFAGAAGFGSALSFAGFDFTHLLTTGLGVAGSAAGAGIGGGLLGLGSLGKLLVGGGSDALAMKTTLTNVKALSTAMDNLQKAVAVYGAGSRQATVAQAQLNFQMAQAGPAAAAALQVAKNASALTDFWKTASAGAQRQAAAIMNQVISVGTSFVPLVAAAAQRNLTIINQGIKPLFTWLKGPQGVQIFTDLENAFASQLPTAIHAGTQAFELLLRVMDIASSFTGGFITHLDHLFTRLNSMDNAQLSAVITRYVNDFRLWDRFIKLLVTDIYLLFHQDVGTGNSIIAALTGMLVKLHAYETSARGSAQIQSIFMVHKTEVLALLHILGSLIATFVNVYMAVAPALVAAMNNVVLPVLRVVADVIASIARTSPFAATAIGLGLIAAKAGGVMATANAVKSLVQWTLGLKAASAGLGIAGAAGAAGTAAAGAAGAASRIPTSAAPLLEAGAGGMAIGGASFGATIASAAATALPFLLAGGALALITAGIASRIHGPTFVATAQGTRLQGSPPSGGPLGLVQGGRPSGPTPFGGAGVQLGSAGQRPAAPQAPVFQAGEALSIKQIGDYSRYSATRLAELVAEIKKAGSVNVNGISQPRDQVLKLAEAALKVKEDWNRAFNSAWSDVNLFYRNTSRTLPALYDDFNSNMRLIASTMGLNSNEGRKLVAANVQKMVVAVTAGMLDGKISVQRGMKAINQALKAGSDDGAITWDRQWRSMFLTVTELYQQHKIHTKTYLADLAQIQGRGYAGIRGVIKASLSGQQSDLAAAEALGKITHGQYLHRLHLDQVAANTQQATDLEQFGGNLIAAMVKAGTYSAGGADAILKPLNEALKKLGQKPLSLVGLSVANVFSTVAGAGAAIPALFGGPKGATGMKVHAPTYVVGEEGPQHPEYVLATNPAYRERNRGLWAAAGHDLGIPGFAKGGTPGQISAPGVTGAGAVADVLRAGLALVAKDANAFLGKQAPKGPGGAGAGHAVSVPGNVASWLAAGMALAGVSGPLWMPMLSRQTMRESGGNPASVNRTDINAQQGNPSEGLLQTTLSTFASNMVPGHGNILNPVDNTAAAIRYMIGRYGGGNADTAVQVMWARGGGAYARGGTPGHAGAQHPSARVAAMMAAAKKKGNKPKRGKGLAGWAPNAPHPGMDTRGWASSGLVGTDGPFPFSIADLDPINAVLAQIFALDGQSPGGGNLGGDAQTQSSLIQFYTSLWGSSLYPPSIPGAADTFTSWDSPSAFVLTTDAKGATVDPYLSANLPGVIGELSQAAGWQGALVGDLTGALGLSTGLVGPVKASIATRVAEVAKIKARVKANAAQVKAKQAKITANLARIAQLRKQIAGAQGKIAAERKKKHPNAAAIKAWGNQITGWQGQIERLQDENQRLGGSPNAVGTGGEIGPLQKQNIQLGGDPMSIPSPLGGELGTISSELGAPAGGSAIDVLTGTGTSASGLYDLQSILAGWIAALGGQTGDIATQTIQLREYQQALGNLGAVVPGPATSAAASAAQANPLTGSLAFTYRGQVYTAGLAQGGMLSLDSVFDSPTGPLSRLPAFGGSFYSGGVVPGQPGEPRTVIAHGGEIIGQPGQGGGASLSAAVDRLTQALSSHQGSVEKLTQATDQNTSATHNQTSGMGRVGYTPRNPYSSHLSSDDVVALTVGS
jgi:hypothetical protein